MVTLPPAPALHTCNNQSHPASPPLPRFLPAATWRASWLRRAPPSMTRRAPPAAACTRWAGAWFWVGACKLPRATTCCCLRLPARPPTPAHPPAPLAHHRRLCSSTATTPSSCACPSSLSPPASWWPLWAAWAPASPPCSRQVCLRWAAGRWAAPATTQHLQQAPRALG